MNDEAGFLRVIQDSPEEDEVRRVYADWLEQRGDIRGEYLRLEHQLTHILPRLVQLREQIDQTWLASVSKRRTTVYLPWCLWAIDQTWLASVSKRGRVADDAFSGTWAIVDGTAGGWVRLDIMTDGQAWAIRTWADSDVHNEASWRDDVVRYAGDEDHLPGPFVPPPAARLYLLADTVCDTEMKYGFASWDHGFADLHLTLRLEGDALIAEDFTVFKDDSGRSNYRAHYKFKKAKEPAQPGTTADRGA